MRKEGRMNNDILALLAYIKAKNGGGGSAETVKAVDTEGLIRHAATIAPHGVKLTLCYNMGTEEEPDWVCQVRPEAVNPSYPAAYEDTVSAGKWSATCSWWDTATNEIVLSWIDPVTGDMVDATSYEVGGMGGDISIQPMEVILPEPSEETTVQALLDEIARRVVEQIGADAITGALGIAHGGTGAVSLAQAKQNLQIPVSIFDIAGGGAGLHNSIYRGQSLGTSVTAEQYAHIADGSFDGMWIGDYWTILNIVYRIGAFNYWLHVGDIECIAPNVMLVPDGFIGEAKKMNDSATTSGGYGGSKMRSVYLDEAKALISAAFGGHVLSHRECLVSSVSSGKPVDVTWYDCTVELMSERMVFGNAVNGCMRNGDSSVLYTGTSTAQLPLFALCPEKKIASERDNYWLRDESTNAQFCLVGGWGNQSVNDANRELGVRPCFAICA